MPTLSIDWSIGDLSGDVYEPLNMIGNAIEDGLDLIAINNVTLDLGSLVGEVLGPLLSEVQRVTQPFQPIIDILLTEIPVISDLFSPVTFLDLAGAFGNVDTDFIETVVEVIDLINSLPTSPESVGIDFGSIVLYDPGDAATSGFRPWAKDFSYASAETQIWFDGLADIDFDAALAGQPASSTKEFISNISGGGDFSFPLFEGDGASQIFGLFLNRPVDLVYFDIPALDVGFLYENFIPVLGPLGVSIRGQLGAYIDFHAVGYDTFGLQRFASTGFVNPLLLLDGLYLNDYGTPDGTDMFGDDDGDNPELTLSASLSATAELNLGIARGGAEGGVFAEVFFDLYDPLPDGKIRGSEVIGVVETELLLGATPIEAVGALFDISGQLTARLFAFYEINLLLDTIREEIEITPPLVLYDFEFIPQRKPRLASDLGNGVLQLNIGEFAQERLNQNIEDVTENIVVTQVNASTVQVSGTLTTSTGDVITIDPQTYQLEDENDNPVNLTRIIARAGQGDDTVDLSGVTGDGIDFDLDGGDGDDTLLAGTGIGSSTILGGIGDDQITGGAGIDLLIGGLGADIILGQAGADVIFGDDGDASDTLYRALPGPSAGDDTIDAGSGDDVVLGGGGDDDITGGTGADVLVGDTARIQVSGGLVTAVLDTNLPLQFGADTIRGNAGADLIYGGRGDDRLDGGADADQLFGEAGFDTLFGGSASDIIDGGTEGDSIFGLRDPGAPAWADNADVAADAADLILGGAGNDDISAQAGADEVRGGTGADDISGGSGADLLFGDSDPDVIRGDDGDDEIIGGAGSDQLFGDAGLDVIHGNAGEDEIRGGDDADSLFGERGADQIFGGLGDDRVLAGEGNDIVFGDAGMDLLFGEAGDDIIGGGDDPDQIYGGAGEDNLAGDGGNDFIDAGSGVVNTITGGLGDDIIFGSDEGDEDADFSDFVFFGDVISGGGGNDWIQSLGGADKITGGTGDDEIDGGTAGDFIEAGAGDDTVYAGVGDDTVYGYREDPTGDDAGSDRLFGQQGQDLLVGGAGPDVIDAGVDTDIVLGGAGDDEIRGGGGDGDNLSGEAGEDLIYGSDDGGDIISGGADRDRIFAQGGNDQVSGGGAADLIDAGAGDDTLEGDAGSDVLVGGADNDILYGHNQAAAGDDNAVDYLYGDFGDNIDVAGIGRDQLFGQGGNDLLFGEGEDDAIEDDNLVVALGISNIIDFGSGESGTPEDFVPPTVTPDPALQPATDDPRAAAELPAGPVDYDGRWTEFAGSATGDGVSAGQGIAPDVDVLAGNGERYVAWADSRSGNYEIYVARQDGSGWTELAGSAGFGGVSDTLTASRRPSLSLDASGAPVVAWTEITATGSEIRAARYDATANAGSGGWLALGSGVVSSGGAADSAQLLLVNNLLTVGWLDASTGSEQVYVSQFNGTSWVAFSAGSASGTGISGLDVIRGDLRLATDGTKLAAAYTVDAGGIAQVTVREFDTGSWNEVSPGVGLGEVNYDSVASSLAYFSGDLFVSWTQFNEATRSEIAVGQYNGASWTDYAASGIGEAGQQFTDAQLAAAGGRLHLVWSADQFVNGAYDATAVYAQVWQGSVFGEELPGDSSARGVSYIGARASGLALSVDGNGNPFVAFVDSVGGDQDLHLLGNLYDIGTVYTADGTGGNTVQDVLNGNVFSANDVLLVTGADPGGIVLTGAHASLAIVGAPGASIAGAVTLSSAADGVLLQNLDLQGGVTVSGADDFNLLTSSVSGGVIIDGGSGTRIAHNQIDGAPAIILTNGAADAAVEFNTLTGAGGITLGGSGVTGAWLRGNAMDVSGTGVSLAAISDGTIRDNDILAATLALDIQQAFSGLISGNDIRGATIGVHYAAAAPLVGNRIYQNTTGVVSSVAGSSDGLGFALVGEPNEIYDNGTGVNLVGRMQNQVVRNNTVGVTGSGILGGTDLDLANLIEFNAAGVQSFAGTIQYNKIGNNGTGIDAVGDQKVFHNAIYRNTGVALQISGVSDVRVVNNSFYAPAGDNIRIEFGASEVEILNNILWAEAGYDIYVANDSWDGFYSDYNNLYATGSGKLVH